MRWEARMLAAYSEAAKVYSGSLTLLQARLNIIPRAEYQRARALVEKKRQLAKGPVKRWPGILPHTGADF